MSHSNPTFSSKKVPAAVQRIERKPGANADVTITAHSIERNEFRTSARYYRKGSKLRPNMCIFIAASNSIADDLLSGTTAPEKKTFLAMKMFEIVICEQCLESVEGKSTNLRIVIKVPSHCTVTTFAEYKRSGYRAFLMKAVDALEFFKSMQVMDVVLDLPHCCTTDMPDIDAAWGFVFPFYSLTTFTNWKIRFQFYGGRSQMIFKANLRKLDEKYDAFRAGGT
ncbi:uncharacterized protein LY89DRAFT_737429 [Mollisia scopiformis]|uniref:Uncharacterized protein n=1 Tax=Mollisia scopiformis TaxID=149040 RepID=A0A194WZS7_MOLSC|nr:uncharacterized protein LY89DRAFT_737429 [Mollisia scopiformis]KUJ13450.1 hypothetical protein LY89DRAFT_737429 [Mollisia scopiformis]